MHLLEADCCSELQLGSSPVSPLGVVPDFIVGLVSDPVGHGPVLLDLFRHSHLLSEGLDRTLGDVNNDTIPFRL